MHFVTLCVTQRFCDVSRVCLRLKAPFRPSATYFEGSKYAKSWLRFRPDFVGFLRPLTTHLESSSGSTHVTASRLWPRPAGAGGR
ncbi:hypothetical protein PMA4326_007615 [Pseudomonas syringae pv. maculicola str. ES4326]|uniref:Uncharacterized protein n=1 Tax=Pseudomonas syringae pv. maculicola str. ES4326 TaxID=629265 RepID=A0A8T8BYY4_PSEYM|nr:hypothetical protein PMA4326_007615 [Pseudomonas syringae pv. maculicola str. ES4326]